MKKKVLSILILGILISTLLGLTVYAKEEKKGTYGTLPPISVQDRMEQGTYLRANTRTIAGQWIQDASTGRWWYSHEDGSYTTDDWEKIGDRWYHFDSDGWMETGWFTDVDGKQYFLHQDEGYMMVEWVYWNSTWYYMDEHGVMVKGWVHKDDNYYYMRETNGSMVTGVYKIDNIVCFFNLSSGVMENRYLNITRRRQQKDLWCWIASAEMIGKYVNPSSTLTQGEVATRIAGLGLLDEPNFSALFPAAAKAVEMFGGDKITGVHIYGRAMPYMYTIENIEAQRPLLAYLSWDLLSGHDVVISGYSVIDESIRVIDPWEDVPTQFVPYDDALAGYQFGTGYGKYANAIYITR